MKRWFYLLTISALMLSEGCLRSYKRAVVNSDELRISAKTLDSKREVVLHLKGARFVETSIGQLVFKEDSIEVTRGVLYTLTDSEGSKIEHVSYSLDEVLFAEIREPLGLLSGPAIVNVITTVATLTDLGITGFCFSEPKACFGSCPTFYNSDGVLVAEGFSLSLFKPFEEWDLDRINAVSKNGRVSLTMRNEALETHLVHNVNLVAVPRNGKDVFFDRGSRSFIRVDNITKPVACHNCDLKRVRYDDQDVYVSKADSVDLANRDTITLIFKNPGGDRIAVDIKARNSLLGTHILYGIIGLAGQEYWKFVHMMENPVLSKLLIINGFRKWKKYGRMNVLVNNRKIGSFRYEGPIAFEHFTLTFLNPMTDSIIVQLDEIKGDWELDYIILGRVVEQDADFIELSAELPHNCRDYYRTYPGDSITLTFNVGEGDYQFFLKTRGYYYEWQRTAWAKQPDPRLASYLFFHPDSAYKYFAKSYKAGEVEARNIFINSRVRKHVFSLNKEL